MQEPVSIRILLADDQPLFRKAIAMLIGDQPDLTIVGEAENGLQAVEMARGAGMTLIGSVRRGRMKIYS